MKRNRHLIALALMFGIAVSGLGLGTRHQASAQDSGGVTGTSILSFDPPTLTLDQGASGSARVTVKLASGTTKSTTLKTTDVPSGVTISFNPPTGDPTFTSIMAVKALSSARPGVYTIKVQAAGNDPSAVTPFEVTITAKSSEGGY